MWYINRLLLCCVISDVHVVYVCVQVMLNVIATVNILANISVHVAIAMTEHTFLVTYCITGILQNFQCRILHLTFSSVFLMIHCLALKHLPHQFCCTKRCQSLMRCTAVGHSCFIWVHSSAHVQDLEGRLCSIVVISCYMMLHRIKFLSQIYQKLVYCMILWCVFSGVSQIVDIC